MNITDYFPDYTEVGYVKKSYGVHGHVRVFIQSEYTESLAEAEHCFFLLKGCLVPYFVEETDGELIKFESCNNPEDTKLLASRQIFLQNEQLLESRSQEDSSSFIRFQGYTILNSDTEEICGEIIEVVTYPEQEIAIVQRAGTEVMIPLNVHNVKGINQEEKLIFVEIPDGLLDL